MQENDSGHDARLVVERAIGWIKQHRKPSEWRDTRVDPLVIIALLTCGEHHQSPIIREGIESLLNRQEPDGGWSSEVWDTTYTIRALTKWGLTRDAPQIKMAVNWLLGLQDRRTGSWHGEIWETSFSILSLKECGFTDDFAPLRRAIDWLESCQLKDGSWLHAPHLTGVALLALSSLYHDRSSISAGRDWLLDYGKNEIWTDECYANAYCLLALAPVGSKSVSPAIHTALQWLVDTQIVNNQNSGFWTDEEDTCLAVIAMASTLALQFEERRVLSQPVTAECAIIYTGGFLNWQVAIPTKPRMAWPLQIDEAFLTKVVNETNQFSITASRSPVLLGSLKDSPELDDLMDIGREIWNLFLPKGFRDLLRTERTDHILLELGGSRAISAVPWEIAYDDTSHDFLALRFAVGRQILRTDIASQYPQTSGLGKPRILFVGNPTRDLPESGIEVQKIADDLSKRNVADCILLEETKLGLTKAGLLKELIQGNYDIIHYAGHATFNREDTNASYLMLLDEDGAEAKFYAREILNASNIRSPKIVFLNACSSAGTDEDKVMGDPGGFATAFISKGTASFIGPLWQVNDGEAAALATIFYSNISSGFTVGEALRIARQEIKKRKNLSWAAFVLYGDPTFRIFT